MTDFRSDTVTRPTDAMLKAMMQAKVGDDVFGEDPSVNELERMTAEMFDMEAAVFCPSGTMTNQIAIKVHTQPGDEVICSDLAHVYIYESGGIAFNSGAQVKSLAGDRGRIKAEQVAGAINPVDVHKASSTLVCLENTANRGGGSCYDFEEIKAIRKVCDEHDLALHLDGARLFNALIAKNEPAKQYGELFNSISICLSKGLGCPVGSLLLGSEDFIYKARRIRKKFGGGMRQAGYLAAAGIYALQNNIQRLADDHRHAKQIAEHLQQKPFVKDILPVETNILIFSLTAEMPAKIFAGKMKEQDILVMDIAPTQLRIVTHLDISDEMTEKVCKVIDQL